MRKKLAIEGGDKVIKEPLPGWPQFSQKTIREALAPLKNGKVNYWTGPRGMEFEEKWAAYNGTKFAISTTSGTSALHTALAGLGIGPGDEVIVPSYTFIATSFSVLQAGAIPVFADVEIDSHCTAVDSIREKITERTRAIMPVHLYGNMADMD
ncbi:MAG: aminotransferase DegT, partial [Planctomycetes bacterium DG_23]